MAVLTLGWVVCFLARGNLQGPLTFNFCYKIPVVKKALHKSSVARYFLVVGVLQISNAHICNLQTTAMKKMITACLLLVSTYFLSAQVVTPDELVRFKQDTTSRYYVSKIKTNQVYIPMDFNSAEMKDLSAWREIKYNTILKVELVYTAYRKSDYFDQPKLNIERLNALRKNAPEAFNSTLTKWKFIAQTDCKTEDEAKNLFHGFVITYRPELAAPLSSDQYDLIHCTVEKYTNPDYSKLIKSAAYGKTKPDLADAPKPPICGENVMELRDTAVLSVLNRKTDWKNFAIVCDVTGSMTPYMAQTLIWLKLNAKATKVSSYTFFNDGDGKMDAEKKVGETGGVYAQKTMVYDTIENFLFATMRKGSGGDAPENNLEAVIKTLEKFPDTKEIVMIADNPANVKDIELLYKIRKPIRIVLCGTGYGINADYLNIARMTGGSVHTIEKDIEDLVKINEGEYFEFKGQKFKLQYGKFKPVYEM